MTLLRNVIGQNPPRRIYIGGDLSQISTKLEDLLSLIEDNIIK